MKSRNSMTPQQMRARAAFCLERAETADPSTASDYRMVAARLLRSANELEPMPAPEASARHELAAK